MRTVAAVLCVVLPAVVHAAEVEAAKIFTDKGSTYLRSDNKKALVVGAELQVVMDAKGGKIVGKAIIMEVTGALARVSLDDEASKAGGKFALLPRVGGGGEAPKAAEASAKPDAPGKGLPELKGKLESGALRVTVTNDSDVDWSGCDLKYSDGTSYKLGGLAKHSDDAVLKVKFGFPAAPLYDHVQVDCAEGEAKFYFARPNAPSGKLKGHAVNEGGGSLTLHNDGDASWSNCDVKKPDGSHYVVDSLKGHDKDGISSTRFRKEAEAKKDLWLDLVCKEGALRIKAN